MTVKARRTDTHDLIWSNDDLAASVAVECPDAKCGSRLHWVRPLYDEHGISRCAFFRHSVWSGCPWGTSRGGAERMTPWHMAWQQRCDDLARIEVSQSRGDSHTKADTVCRDLITAVEYQHSALTQNTITRRENIWLGRVIWVLDSGSRERQGEATLSHRFTWTSTAGLHRRIFRGIVFVDIGQGFLVELPRQGIIPSSTVVDAPAGSVRLWTHDEFTDHVINGDRPPFDFADTLWAVEARAKAQQRRARTRQETAMDRQTRREQRFQRAAASGFECEYTGGDRDRLLPPVGDIGVDAGRPAARKWSGYPCRGCGEMGQSNPATFCDRCSEARGVLPAPFTAAQYREFRNHPHHSNPRSAVFESSMWDRQPTAGDTR